MELRKLIAFGTGVGIEVRGNDLEVVLSRVRPSGVEVLSAAAIHSFRERPAAEWGAEYVQLLGKHGLGHVSATVVLPRRDAIMRLIHVPGVAGEELAAAIGYQLESLHPYGDEEVACGWQRIGDSGAVVVGIARRSTLDGYIERFTEAGVKTASFTFPGTVWRAASRLFGAPAGPVLAVGYAAGGEVEIYGESPSRALFSAEFDASRERAVTLASAELRLATDLEATRLDCLPPPPVRSRNFDLSRSTLAYAASLSGACPWLAPAANLLPAELRSANARGIWIPTAALAVVLLLLGGAAFGYSIYGEKRYRETLRQEIAKVEPSARKAAALDKALAASQRQARTLDDFRGRSKADLDALQELTKILEPPVWASQVVLSRDQATITGEAEQAAQLLKLIDASPYYQKSAFTLSLVKAEKTEMFRIRAEREKR